MAIQASVARTVARIVQAKLTAQDEDQLARVLIIRPETFESYLRAMFQFQKETQEGYQEGIENLEEALANAWYHWAWWLELMGDDEEAIAAGEKTVELSPLSSFYLSWLTEQYRDAGDYQKAIELAESVIALSPRYPIAWVALGNVYLDQGRYDEAIAAHEKLAHLPFWAWVLGQTYAWAGQPEKALEVAQGYEQESRKDIPLAINLRSRLKSWRNPTEAGQEFD